MALTSEFTGSIGWGSFFGLNAMATLEHLLERAAVKSAVLQRQLSQAPELTEELYQSAIKVAEDASSGDLYWGIVNATAAGFSFGLCVYYASRKEKE